MNPDQYPVYPEDDGHDRFRNPYSPVCKPRNLSLKEKNLNVDQEVPLGVQDLTAVMATMLDTAEIQVVKVAAKVAAKA